jgi:hypothetical protein
MNNRTIIISPLVYARIAGVLYLINIACGMFGELFVRGHLVVAGDAVATAHRIMTSEFLFRCGIAGDLIMHITDVPMAVIFMSCCGRLAATFLCSLRCLACCRLLFCAPTS